MPNDLKIENGDRVQIAGYGETYNFKSDFGILFSGSSTISQTDNGKGEVVLDGHDVQGACHGDSGGPAYLDQNGHLYLVGTDSRSGSFGMCAYKEVYTSIRDHFEWIKQGIEELRKANP